MNVKDSPLYKSLCKSVRKQDHAELLRMLEMVPVEAWFKHAASNLIYAFVWEDTPQDFDYWNELYCRVNGIEY